MNLLEVIRGQVFWKEEFMRGQHCSPVVLIYTPLIGE
jgi:hypothetical protein